MPEGDAIYRTAETLRRVLAGRVVTVFESQLPQLTRVDEDAPIVGRTILDVRAVGKHAIHYPLLYPLSTIPAVRFGRTACRPTGLRRKPARSR
jgi:hypothetical protein